MPARDVTPDPGSRVSRSIGVEGVAKSFGDTTVLHDVSIEVPAGQMLALLGPSGCGKTTLLRIIAGLERPDRGSVQSGDRVLVDESTFVAPDKREIGLVFQDGALFPHLSVGGNVGYGLHKLKRPMRAARVAQALSLVGLTGFEDRSPATLSGGQQQRVALARALAPRPGVLLLDEPFSNLDASLRGQLRTELHRLVLDLGITTVFVTHDQEEAFVLGDEVAVMREGRIVQRAEPALLYRNPVDRWVAGFVGAANLVSGVGDGDHASTALGRIALSAPATGPVDVLVRPECLDLSPGTAGTIDLVEFRGSDTSYLIDMGGGVAVRAHRPSAADFARADLVDLRYVGPPTVAFAVSDPPSVDPGGDEPAAADVPPMPLTSR